MTLETYETLQERIDDLQMSGDISVTKWKAEKEALRARYRKEKGTE